MDIFLIADDHGIINVILELNGLSRLRSSILQLIKWLA